MASTAYQLALKLAALPPGARGGADYGMASSVAVAGHETTVIVPLGAVAGALTIAAAAASQGVGWIRVPGRLAAAWRLSFLRLRWAPR